MNQITKNTASAVRELRDVWEILFPNVAAPDHGQWSLWLLRHDADVVRYGIAQLGVKYRRLKGEMDALWMAKYASAAMNRQTNARNEHHTQGTA